MTSFQKIKILAFVAIAFLINGCSTFPKTLEKFPVQLSAILDQVNDATLAAKAMNQGEKVPDIVSVRVDMEIGTSSGAEASGPINIVATDGEVDNENVQEVSVTFAPHGTISSDKIEQAEKSQLALAIGAINKAVSQTNPIYEFQKGQVRLQCTLKQSLGADAKLLLVPIHIGVHHSHELVQTITLGFGPKYFDSDINKTHE